MVPANAPRAPIACSAVTGRVLLLNATYEPLALVSDRRAIVLVLAGRAEAVALRPDATVFHSAQLAVEVPAIVRLFHMVRIPRWARTPPLTRRAVLRRDGGRCAYCSAPADTVDHVIPRSRGGPHEWGNVVASCQHDNLTKGDSLLDELGWALPFQPAGPRGPPLAAPASGRGRPAVGALPRPRLLTNSSARAMTDEGLFDFGAVRRRERRWFAVRDVERATLVLGSTQAPDLVDADALERTGTVLLKRRSGGGAVLLEPGRAVWIDTWVPRADPLFEDDVSLSRTWVGAWWAAALGGIVTVHEGPPLCTRWSDAVCFGGTAAGEVVAEGRKVVGVAQWRAREGALTHSLAYVGSDWELMVRLLGLPVEAAGELAASTATLGQLLGARGARDSFITSLLDHLPGELAWDADLG